MPELVLKCGRLARLPLPSPDGEEVSIDATAKSSVREILERYRIVPRKRFGQNFLHDPAIAARIAALAGVGRGDRVLEIGPGLGALTRPLLAAGANVVAVEVDRRIAEYLAESLEGDFELRVGDVLRLELDDVAPEPATLVANLPYSITGPILALLIEHADRFPRACLMVQREVGARLVAGSGSRELGAPAVLLRLLYRVKRAFDVGRGAFVPAPDIVSTVLRLDRLPESRLEPGLRDAINAAYRQRRKMVRKTLKGIVASEDALASALVAIGQPDSARPEDLEPEEWPVWIAAAKELDR